MKLAEESAEIIQQVSKVLLYGNESRDSTFGATYNHRKKLQEEIGDFMAVIGLLTENGIIDSDEMDERINKSMEKLRNRKELEFLFE